MLWHVDPPCWVSLSRQTLLQRGCCVLAAGLTAQKQLVRDQLEG